MNCKPGDLAIVVRGEPLEGRLVEVLYAAPAGDHNLPDGFSHSGSKPNTWVVKFLGSTVQARIGEYGRVTGTRDTLYGCIKDWRLRPLRGEPETIEERDTLNADA